MKQSWQLQITAQRPIGFACQKQGKDSFFFPPKHRAMFNPNPRSCVNDPTVNVSLTPVVVTPRERLLYYGNAHQNVDFLRRKWIIPTDSPMPPTFILGFFFLCVICFGGNGLILKWESGLVTWNASASVTCVCRAADVPGENKMLSLCFITQGFELAIDSLNKFVIIICSPFIK